MKKFLSNWLSISFLNLLWVGILGFLLRYKIAYSLPFLEQKNVLHSHSHFAFSGWVTQTLMLLMIYFLSRRLENINTKKYHLILLANLFCSYGMLVTFIVQGYAPDSIFFSTMSILVSYIFALSFWRDLNRLRECAVSVLWFKAALVSSFISSAGPFALAVIMIQKISDPNWHLASTYFFLHFQYNGWFLFAGFGLLCDRLERSGVPVKTLYYILMLFGMACIPAYFLSVLWVPFLDYIYFLIIAAVAAQLLGWILLIKLVCQYRQQISLQFNKCGKILLILSAIAFSFKLLLQTGSIHPGMSQLSYGFRPIVIGYLHLVLLGVTSIFILGYIIGLNLLPCTKAIVRGTVVFVAGVIINELLLAIQGIAALSYKSIPYINLMLLSAAAILVAGIFMILVVAGKNFLKIHS